MTLPGAAALKPFDSWTARFLREWLPCMSVGSALRWRGYQIRERQGRLRSDRTLPLALRTPVRGTVHLREVGSDRYTFQEVMVRQVYGVLAAHVPECASIVDLGANIGLTSLYLAALYPGSRILAVEPDARNFRLLQANLRRLIAAARVQALQAAVWDHDAPLHLSAPASPEDYDAFTVHEADSRDSPSVPGLSMASLLDRAGFERADILKIDIEGAEATVFSGDVGWLSRVGAVAVEFHADSRRACGFDVLMRRHGFDVIEANAHTVLALKRRLP